MGMTTNEKPVRIKLDWPDGRVAYLAAWGVEVELIRPYWPGRDATRLRIQAARCETRTDAADRIGTGGRRCTHDSFSTQDGNTTCNRCGIALIQQDVPDAPCIECAGTGMLHLTPMYGWESCLQATTGGRCCDWKTKPCDCAL
jgi:hypothetical protein